MGRVVVAGGGLSIPHELGDDDSVVALRIHTLNAMAVGSKLGITVLRLGNQPHSGILHVGRKGTKMRLLGTVWKRPLHRSKKELVWFLFLQINIAI